MFQVAAPTIVLGGIDAPNAIYCLYLGAAILFILGIKQLSHPSTARSGNLLAAIGMAVAVVAALMEPEVESYTWIVVGIVIGAVVGAASARMVKMTAMPQMVALFNGVGGGAVALIAIAEFHKYKDRPLIEFFDLSLPTEVAATIPLGILIGSISFAGSMIAFAKLQELMTGRPVLMPAQNVFAGGIALVALFLIVFFWAGQEANYVVWVLFAVSLIIGVIFVLPVGGADMPVIISLLNSFTGLSAALAGFMLDNLSLIVAGTLVGASGTFLTMQMGKAMNRSVVNVLFGAFGGGGGQAGIAVADGEERGPVRSGLAADAAILMSYAREVIIVPGYGLAVAQAQHSVRRLQEVLEEKGIAVKYAIHPVAGRMPGHMNVLLAEADVPYPDLFDMDDINPEFARADVALVVGANDVTNPAARTNPESPIYGMPVLNVDQAQNVVFLKRSLSPGFAGIDNDLFYDSKTMMVFGDAKETLDRVVEEVEQL